MALGVSFGALISLLVVALVCVLSTDAATLGQVCNATTITCTGDHVVCSNNTNTCVCDTGYQHNSAGSDCAVGLSSRCPNLASDKCLDPNAVCTNETTVFTCRCNSSYYNNGGTCVLKVALGGACPTGTTGACLDTNANCTGTCTCKSTHYKNNGICEPKVALGGVCPTGTTDACLDANATCNGTCICKSTHYNNTGTCEQKKSLGYTCSPSLLVAQCADANAECVVSSATGTCQCKAGFYDNNGESLDGMCLPKVELNRDCSHPSACVTNNATCINSKCSCQSGFYDSNGVIQGGLCNIKEGLGSLCPQPDACGTTDAVCSNPSGGGTCVCGNGYYDTNGNTALGGSCLIKVGLGLVCPQPDACSTTNAVCSNPSGGGTCVCGNGYYDSNGNTALGGICLIKTDLGQQCPQPDACQPQNSECGSGTVCVCSASYFDSNGVSNIGGSCSAKLGLGNSCTQLDSCSDINSNCNQGTCVCKAGYYDSNGSGTNGGSCELTVGLGGGCPRPEACSTPYSMCSIINGGGTCVCSSTYYDDNGDILGGNCQQKVLLGDNCTMSTACAAAMSSCDATTCQCLSAYYDDTGANIGGSCQYRLVLNTQCEYFAIHNYNQMDQCQDGNAACFFNSSYNVHTCICNPGYHPEGSTCVADRPLGGNCTYKTDCSDPNADCIRSKCTCGIKYYDSNGRADGGNCMQMSDLQVTGITFPSFTMYSITVNWSLPAASPFINVLVVAWRPSSETGQTVNETLGSPTQTSYTISQLEQGRAYIISIISKNTQTDLTSDRETKSIGYQAAKPNKPGPLQLTDLDASDQNITLGWPAVSYSSGFNVVLLDGSGLLGSYYVPTNSWTLCNKTLLNGHRYNVVLVTRSEYFTSVNHRSAYVPSEPYLEQIKTTVKIPGPPQSPQCMTEGFYSILLKWLPPTFPNGDLVQYHIEVYEKDKPFNAVAKYRTGNTSTAYTVTGLKTGFNYFLKVTTENEMYNSTSVEANNCKTTAGRSGEPTNLTVTGVTSRSMNVAWSYPEKTNSEEILGYILQIKNNLSTCVHERLFKCLNCTGSFQVPVGMLCPVDVRQADIWVSKQQLKERQIYTVTGLLPDIEYTMSVSAVNPDGQGNISFLVQRSDEEEADEVPVSAIIGGVVGGVAALLIIGIIIGVLMYRRRNQGPSKMTKIVEDPMQKVSSTEDANIARKRPVNLPEFPTYVADMHEELNLKFSLSFEDLKAVSLNHKQSVATETKNQMKNRDMNILPYDHTRVVLRSEHGMDDYINASFLPGYRSAREYIGSQGPLPGTVNDFWRMVWEQNVSAVVMLTLCQEDNEVKCEQYWPSVINEPNHFGDVEVQLISSSSFPNYNHNVMKLVCNGRPRTLEHFHFLSWRNMARNYALIDFITQVRKHVQLPDTAGPMIVHCSNGAGRTGIYIILDHLMQFIDDHDFGSSIDIFGMVLKLRENRPNIVQTVQQCEFIHDCVNIVLDRKLNASSQGNTYETLKSSERDVYQNQQEHAYEMLKRN